MKKEQPKPPKLHPRPKAAAVETNVPVTALAELPPQGDTPPVPVTGTDFPPNRVRGVGTLGAYQNVPYYENPRGEKIVADGHPLAGQVIR
jgi:hypothetical protein